MTLLSLFIAGALIGIGATLLATCLRADAIHRAHERDLANRAVTRLRQERP
ncbi:MAG: hypothetical protein ACKOAF_04965 [Actinomycetes bacterium]